MATFTELCDRAGVVGQHDAVSGLGSALKKPVHAYLLVGPAGVGADELALAFAAALLGGLEDADITRRCLGPGHPDLLRFIRAGAALSVPDARSISDLAFRTPVERPVKVIVIPEMHLLTSAGPALLKTIEEPPASTVFVMTAEQVTADLVTIASRSVRIDLSPLHDDEIAQALVASGAEPEQAELAAASSGGRLDRARLLANDAGFATRQAAWRSVAGRLDGSGHVVSVLVDELLGLAEGILVPLRDRHEGELAELDQLDKITGRKAARADVVERHKRELRKVRTDDLKAGLATLSHALRERLAEGRVNADALDAVRDATAAMIRNPNEPLLLSALFLRIGAAGR